MRQRVRFNLINFNCAKKNPKLMNRFENFIQFIHISLPPVSSLLLILERINLYITLCVILFVLDFSVLLHYF